VLTAGKHQSWPELGNSSAATTIQQIGPENTPISKGADFLMAKEHYFALSALKNLQECEVTFISFFSYT